MKRRVQMLGLILILGLVLAACGKKETVETAETTETTTETTEAPETAESTESEVFDTEEEILVETEVSEETEEEVVEEETREGMFRSELTNEWIDESLWGQRPIAVMVDNDKRALPHFGISAADVVYEMMNSTANKRVTRLMCIVKDWGSITQFGSVRSVRTTNLQLLPEWNAILCHDGGPGIYINAYLQNPYVDNISGTFKRFDNGKPREFTEYIATGEVARDCEKKGISTQYNEWYQGPHFTFTTESKPVDLASASDSFDCTLVDLPFENQGSELRYNAETGLYEHYEFGEPHVDAGNGNAVLCFKNVLLQDVVFQEYDSNGYFGFQVIDSGRSGYFITEGKAIPVTWEKDNELDITRYYDKDGNEITLNTGKTYIGLVPYDNWDELVLK